MSITDMIVGTWRLVELSDVLTAVVWPVTWRRLSCLTGSPLRDMFMIMMTSGRLVMSHGSQAYIGSLGNETPIVLLTLYCRGELVVIRILINNGQNSFLILLSIGVHVI